MLDLEATLKGRLSYAMERAKRYDQLTKRAEIRLRKFSLLARIFRFTRFEPLRKKIGAYAWERFKYTSVALSIARQLKHLRYKERNSNQ